VQECEQTLMQYSRKLDTYGDCEMTSELADALTTLAQDAGVQQCVEHAVEYHLIDYAE